MTGADFFGLIGGALAFLLAPLLGLVAWTFTTFRAEALRSIETLRSENREQALKIAKLESSGTDERMISILEKLDTNINALAHTQDRSNIILERIDRKLSSSGGEYPATRRT